MQVPLGLALNVRRMCELYFAECEIAELLCSELQCKTENRFFMINNTSGAAVALTSTNVTGGREIYFSLLRLALSARP